MTAGLVLTIQDMEIMPAGVWTPGRARSHCWSGQTEEREITGQALQKDLRNYTRLLADMADVEDLPDLEAV